MSSWSQYRSTRHAGAILGSSGKAILTPVDSALQAAICQASLQAQSVYKMCKQLFAALPLAAVVGGAALVLHGGLFRRPAQRAVHRSANGQALPKKRKRYNPMRSANTSPILGSMEVGCSPTHSLPCV